MSIKHEDGPRGFGDPEANIIVRNLPKNATQDQVRAAFVTFGEILSCKVEVFNDGTSKGFAYIQFKNPADAQKSIAAMNGTSQLGSSSLAVSVHKKKDDRQTPDIFTNLHVSNLDESTTKEDLRKMFEAFGEIDSTYVPPPQKVKGTFYGYVSFKNPEDAGKAIE